MAIKLKGFKGLKFESAPFRPLYHSDGKPVKVGDTVTSFRGEKATVTGWPNDGRNRVWIKFDNGDMGTEYFPSVFNLKWEA